MLVVIKDIVEEVIALVDADAVEIVEGMVVLDVGEVELELELVLDMTHLTSKLI
jgi:hypothetical protein